MRKIFLSTVVVTLTLAGAVGTKQEPARAASIGDQLGSGEVLASGDSLDSVDDTYHLVMQADGNLVDSGPDGQSVWQTATSSPGASLLNESDGNLIIRAADGSVVWETDYDPARGPSNLIIDDSGNLVDEPDSGAVIWVIYASPAPGSSLTRAGGAAAFASAQLGKPYVFGATGPSSYDNSGLALASYAAVGLAIPHSAAGQLAATTPVRRCELRVGDLVFYSDGRLVAVYVGNDMVVMVASPGTLVRNRGIDWSTIYAIGRVPAAS